MSKPILKRLLNASLAPLLHRYTAIRPRERFTDSEAALRLLAPLMRNAEDANYHRNHLERYLVTMEFLKDLPNATRVLEIGAPPYGMTVLMKKWLFDQVAVTGYDDKSAKQYERMSEQNVSIKADDGTVLFEGCEHRFNLEIHRWPFQGEQFDSIIGCETFEHFGLDPMHAYAEANRVLKTGGRLFVTVPNGASLSNGVRYMKGEQPNSFPFYRPEGFVLRSEREPTPDEMDCLLKAAGFEPEFIETFNVTRPLVGRENLTSHLILGLFARPLDRRRELIAARGIKRGPVIDRYPSGRQLYYSWDIERLTKRRPASRG